MPEATIVILDNSSYSINGDYQPTRWMSQIDAAGLLIQTKMEQHHENAMGIALSAGRQVEIICTLSTDLGKVTSHLYGIKSHGHQKLSIALQTAVLALKHRANPNLTQRIICFVASTITDNTEQLKIICKKLRKNNIGIDFIAIGDLSQTQIDKLTAMSEACRTENSGELLIVQADGNVSDALFTSKIIGAEPAQPMINEENDPELLMALQLSLQEENQRLAAQQNINHNQNQMLSEEDELEQRALQLAMQDEGPAKQDDKDKKEE